MTCTCNETRELGYGTSYEGDFVEDFEAMLEELDQEHDQEFDQEARDFELDREIIGVDTRRRVGDTKKAPFRYICNIEYDLPGVGRRSGCTGTLIGPKSVLTAGHCIDGVKASDLRIIPGRALDLEPLPATAAVKTIAHESYVSESATDIGIIHLANDIGKDIGYWTEKYTKTKIDRIGTSFISRASLPLPAGKLKVNLSGYPWDQPRTPKLGCYDRKLATSCHHTPFEDKRRSLQCGTEQYRAYNLTVNLKGGVLHYVNDTCKGHSGSPVWVRRHPSRGGRVLVGVHIAGDDRTVSGKANRAVFLDENIRKWIAKELAKVK